MYRLHDADAFDALRRIFGRMDDDPNCGTRVELLKDPPEGVSEATQRLYKRLRTALSEWVLDDDARICVEALPSRAANAPLVAALFYPRDLTGGPAVATVLAVGVVLRQPGSGLK